ncbi:putative effector protein [Erysiphe neolycopersici]|uniref:Putative effector protein n=1 Tax=Erysiphe neolycopersici TaxID=212602 RepID=A0A420I2C5_9PEZI|nr:putative effector protein [Erysiphe neolycopersici]
MLSDKALSLFFVLLLSNFSLSTAQHGVCRITSRPSQQTCLATDPTTFTINDFTTFEPSEGNPTPASVSFRFYDDDNALTAQCFSNDSLADTSSSVTSESPKVSFTYVENNLKITENYTSCVNVNSTEVEGLLELATNCYLNYPPSPLGNGIKCITPTGKLSGSFV